MTRAITQRRVLGDAWALWRRDRDVLLRLAAPFVLLPSLALRLLVPEPATPADATWTQLLQSRGHYATDHAAALLLAAGATQFGFAALYAFYCDPAAADVRGALARAARRWVPLVLLAAMVQVGVSLGLVLIVPGLILFGRALPAAPLLFSGRREGAARALAHAIRSTAGHTPAATGLAALLLFGHLIAERPFSLMDEWLRSLGAPNPVARAVINGAGAGADMLAAVAAVLVAVAFYRLLKSSGGASRGM